MIRTRINSLRKTLAENLEGAIAIKDNTMYLSEFNGTDSVIVITSDKIYFMTDFRYIETHLY